MRIYKITNLINGKIYIGQTIHSLALRLRRHKNESVERSGMLITKAIKKYGIENFQIEEIEVCRSQDELNAAECKWMEFYQSQFPNGYNLRGGGSRGKMAESSKAKLRGRKFSPETIEKMRKSKQNMSEETKRKMSDSAKGKKLSKKALDNLAKYRHLPKRWYCGEENSQSKLKNEDVLKIRELYDAGNISQKDLAKIFGVSTGVMWRIVHRKGWKSI